MDYKGTFQYDPVMVDYGKILGQARYRSYLARKKIKPRDDRQRNVELNEKGAIGEVIVLERLIRMGTKFTSTIFDYGQQNTPDFEIEIGDGSILRVDIKTHYKEDSYFRVNKYAFDNNGCDLYWFIVLSRGEFGTAHWHEATKAEIGSWQFIDPSQEGWAKGRPYYKKLMDR
jgi:hypothetical protein